ncbi:signal transduction histidine kinase [Rhodococcus sp. LBL1]|nr:signal transduction histidine kinase [Rhodococcus sp. LBL1]MDH6684465.1 signal transduction histidine kinase [Rhodococcus sp. LBL2]
MRMTPSAPLDAWNNGAVTRTSDRLEGLVEALLDVTSGLELPDTLRRVAAAGMRLTGAGYGAVTVRDESGTGLSRCVYEGADEPSRRPSPDGVPVGHPPVRTVLEVPILVRGRVFGNLYLTDKRHGAAFGADDETLVCALASAAGVAIDNARLYDQSRVRRRRLEALQDVSTELLAGGDPDRALQLVADRALELTDSDQSFLAMPADPDEPDDDVDELVIAVASGPESARAIGRHLPVMRSSAGRAFRMRTPSSSDRLEYAPFDRALDAFGPALIVPLRAAGGVTGVLVTMRRRGRTAFDADQLALMTSFADQAALALRLAAAQREKIELDLLADRDRIARDLHDRVIQRLFAAGLSLHGTLARVESPALRDRIDSTIDELQTVIGDIRTAIFDLHEGSGEPGPLGQRVRRAVADLTANCSMGTDVRLRGPMADLSPVVADHVEAVVREAVANAVRHSGADSVRIVVDVGDRVTVEVVDDGSGIGEPVERSGLANLSARAEEVGGTFECGSGAAGGTRIVWSAPVAD